jgi:TonB family protein
MDQIYFGNVDENPLFNSKSAEERFREYVYYYTTYPAKAVENSITGCVFVEFFVERDGSVSNVKIVGSADPTLDAEALRVVNSSPNWTPGRMDGHPVRMSYTIPINFGLNKVNTLSSPKKVKLSKKTTLLKELNILGPSCFCDLRRPKEGTLYRIS